MEPDQEIRAGVVGEIEELHRFFEDWFLAKLPKTEVAFARFVDALDADFVIVSPGGVLSQRAELLDGLRAAHGAWGDGGKIWIEKIQVRRLEGKLAVATYEEWQRVGGEGAKPRGRLSTVVFSADPSAPGGWLWLHVHETWLPEAE